MNLFKWLYGRILPDFREYNKIPRYRRNIIITEKIDGSNAQIFITPEGKIYAGSRTRWLTPGKSTDNYGFAAWVEEHKEELLTLGVGRHFGEWYGKGINRNYGLKDRRFVMFRHPEVNPLPANIAVVPTLYSGVISDEAINKTLDDLKLNGSRLVPGFMRPEGVVIYHVAAGKQFKITLEGDEAPKGKNETKER